VELQKAIVERRSCKTYNHHTTADDSIIKEMIQLASYAPNHGMREPWRVIWIKKNRLAEFAALFADHAFKNDSDKKEKHIETLSQLSGVLIVVGKYDRRQKQFLEDVLAVGAYIQNLSLLFHESGIGSCIKTPGVLTVPGFNNALSIAADEMIYSLIYLTDADGSAPIKERKNTELLTEW